MTRSSPTASTSSYVKDCVARSLSLSLHPTENAGVLTCTGMEMIGSAMVRGAATIASITDTAISGTNDLYKWSGLAATNGFAYDSVDLTTMFHSININLSYGTKFFHDLPSREVMFPKFEVSGDFTLGKGVNSSLIETMKGYVVSSAAATARPLQLTWGDGTISSAGEMNIKCFTKLTKWESSYEDGEQCKFSFVGEYGVAASSEYPFLWTFYL